MQRQQNFYYIDFFNLDFYVPRKFEMCLKKEKDGIDRENNLNLSWKEQRSSLEIVRMKKVRLI